LLDEEKNINNDARKFIYSISDKYAPPLESLESAIENGTYVDDGSFYVRWVDDKLRFGLYAGRDFEPGEMLGIYSGEF
jgi:hypothetical protein